MKFKKILLISALAGISQQALAHDFNYSYLELGFGGVSFANDDDFDNIDYLMVMASYEFNDDFYAGLLYQSEDSELSYNNNSYDFNNTPKGVFLGGHTTVGESTDAVAELYFIKCDYEYENLASGDDEYYTVDLSLRHMLTEKLEVNSMVSLAYDDDFTSSARLGARAYINDVVSVGLNYYHSFEADMPQVEMSARFAF